MSKGTEVSFKIGTFGESRVGKTCIINQYVNNSFNETEESSMAPSISEKPIEVNKQDILLKIWDTAGQERYMTLTKQYFQGLEGLLLVYDVTTRETFEKIQFWIKNIQENLDITSVKINLAANKVDKEKERKVSTEEGQELAKSLGIDYFEVSAKTGLNIEAIFQDLAKKIISSGKIKSDTIAINNKKEKKKEGCCGGDSKK